MSKLNCVRRYQRRMKFKINMLKSGNPNNDQTYTYLYPLNFNHANAIQNWYSLSGTSLGFCQVYMKCAVCYENKVRKSTCKYWCLYRYTIVHNWFIVCLNWIIKKNDHLSRNKKSVPMTYPSKIYQNLSVIYFCFNLLLKT